VQEVYGSLHVAHIWNLLSGKNTLISQATILLSLMVFGAEGAEADATAE
jgi:hypothetical protein